MTDRLLTILRDLRYGHFDADAIGATNTETT